ncbi:MAG: 5-carboxymethyl-2-hydroxymuconate semialdehyde dehydrogenase [Albidovulum sp.]|nr:5-carboxymethyl-2-hydroxymuconate semialdehyde dehydrogenase [Albidovulum sp.]MDE0529981.1 5-carboxymethyl-2-hydroxymuconate semialdehyde dehydrogenase [Albidovulum sp.]
MGKSLKENLNALARILPNLESAPVRNLIGGEKMRAAAGAVFEDRSPVDGSRICDVSRSSELDIGLASDSAESAFAAWRSVAGSERRRILHSIADSIVRNSEEIAVCECWDTGQAIRFMSKAALRGAENFRFFADRAPGARDGKSLPSPTLWNLTTRVPVGPVGIITPWNTPFMLSTWKIAPALAAGCTVVHKPAELSPLTAGMLADIAEEAGLPKGVLNVVHGYGEEAGRALTMDPKVRAIGFVGESRTGSEIMKQGADTLKRVHFELGGKNPVIVFEDADLDRAIDAAVFMIYSLNGERCTSSSRLLVQRSIAAEFLSRFAERAKRIRVGHPLDPATEVGPLIDGNHFEKVASYFENAKSDGAKILVGGEEHPLGCPYVLPTLVVVDDASMRIAQEEVFGPVLTAMEFESEEDAIRIANDIRYGLAGYVWTNDLTRALRIADALEAGMIWVNSENVRHLPTPFGGVKSSGIGRDGGDWSFEFYMEQKHIGIASGRHPIPRLGA